MEHCVGAYGARRTRASGFSVMEILVVIAIIGVLMAVVAPMIRNVYSQAKRYTTTTKLRNLKTQVESFKTDTGRYPQTLQELIDRPTDPKASGKWQGPYIDEESQLEDGWGNEFVYEPVKEAGKPFRLYSWGSGGEGSPEEEWISAWQI